MRYLLLLLLFTVQTAVFGYTTNDLQKSDVKKELTSKKSSLKERSNVEYLYQGQYLDVETGLAYNRFRYYSTESGTYISQDPIGLQGGSALYSYVSDTNNWIDPFGLMPFWKPLKPTGMGHHPIPRTHANSTGMPKLGTKFDSPSWYPDKVEGSDILHKDAHQALKDNGVPFNQKYDGDADSLIKKTKEAYKDFPQKGTLRIPKSGEVIAEKVTLSQSVDESVKWNKKGCH